MDIHLGPRSTCRQSDGIPNSLTADPPPHRIPHSVTASPHREIVVRVVPNGRDISAPVAGQDRCVDRSFAAVGLPCALSRSWSAEDLNPLMI